MKRELVGVGSPRMNPSYFTLSHVNKLQSPRLLVHGAGLFDGVFELTESGSDHRVVGIALPQQLELYVGARA